MEKLNFFPTSLWFDYCDEIDNVKLTKEIYNFSKEEKSKTFSNLGGYQGHNFYNKQLIESIGNRIPRREDKPLSEYQLYTWVNINGKGDRNQRHTHLDTTLLLSGVYYVKVPENSGNIRFYDPRGSLIQCMPDHEYYNNGFAYQYIEPSPGMIIFFPTWLEHDVEENQSSEDRISIAFNVFVRYK